MNPNPPTGTSRVFAGLLALIVAGIGAVVGFGGFVFANLRCDESCDLSGGWRHDPDAWQWTAQAVLAGGAFVASVVLAAMLVSEHRRGRSATFAAGLGLILAWMAFLAGG
jgi:hypothetical protein